MVGRKLPLRVQNQVLRRHGSIVEVVLRLLRVHRRRVPALELRAFRHAGIGSARLRALAFDRPTVFDGFALAYRATVVERDGVRFPLEVLAGDVLLPILAPRLEKSVFKRKIGPNPFESVEGVRVVGRLRMNAIRFEQNGVLNLEYGRNILFPSVSIAIVVARVIRIGF